MLKILRLGSFCAKNDKFIVKKVNKHKYKQCNKKIIQKLNF